MAVNAPGNLFEGEWLEGKPVIKDCQKQTGPMNWLQEAVASVSANLGGGSSQYSSVSMHGDDDDMTH